MNIQKNWSGCGDEDDVCKFFFALPHRLFHTKVIVYSCYVLLLLADSWLAYKTTLVTCLGIFLVTFSELCF